MKRTLILSLLMAAGIAHADCYMRSSTVLAKSKVNTGPVDLQKIVTPDANGFKCIARYRIHIGSEWQTAEGIGYGKTETAACTDALDLGKGFLLEEATPETVKSSSEMVCSDLPDIRVRPVRIGEVIWQSEVDLHTVPAERKDFWYKRSQCRMFVERNTKDGNLVLYQGVICRVDTMPNSKWRVIDKF